MDKVELGKIIRNLRENAELSRESLAEMADMSAHYLGEIERGEKNLGTDKFINIVKALNLSADYVLRNELPSGKPYVYDEITKKLEKLTPKQRKAVSAIIDAYINNL